MSDKDFLEWRKNTNYLIETLKKDYVATEEYLNTTAILELTKLQYQLTVARLHLLQCLIQTMELQVYYVAEAPSVF